MDKRREKERDVGRRNGLSAAFFEKQEGKGLLSMLAVPFLGVMAGLFARAHVVFGTYPLALSLLAVVRGNPLPVWLGATVGAFTMGRNGFVHMLSYVLLMLLRLLFSHPKHEDEHYFDELPQLQITAVILVGVGMGTWQIVAAGLTTYALLYAAASVVAPAICAALFTGVFAAELRPDDLLGTRRYAAGEVQYAGLSPLYVQVGMLTLCCAFSYALCFYHLFGLSLGYMAAAFFSLFIARRWGAMRGCVAGMLLGLSVYPSYAPVFALLGLGAGALFPYGTGYALTLGVGGATVCASYFGGAVGLLGIIPETCIVSLLTWPLYIKMNKEGVPHSVTEEGPCDRAVSYAAEGVMQRRRDDGRQLHLISDALLAVSDSFRREGQSEELPDVADYFAVCDKVCNKFCPSCKNRDLCWEGERPGVSAIGRIAEQLGHSGTLRVGEVTFFPAYCTEENRILRAIRTEAAVLCGGKRRSAHSTQIAAEYMMMSRLLSEEARTSGMEDAPNGELAKKIKKRLAELSPQLADAAVFVRGEKHPSVTVGTRAIEILGDTVDEIRVICEQESDFLFSDPCFEEINRVGTLRLSARPRFRAHAVSAVLSYREGEVSGDAVSWFESSRDDFYALLSDGMGNGRRAARASRLSCIFLEQMLSAGCSVPHTAEMLHHLLRGRSDESSATLDLFTLDCMRGQTSFLKCGAVPSYVKRGDSLFRIRTKTPPIGILKDYAGESVSFEIQDGDIVVLLSDGVTPEGEELPWLLQALHDELTGDLQRAANRILSLAAQKSGSEDDRSIVIIKIEEEMPMENKNLEEESAAS
ncbi:MAG: SpoIIE family protein phosphatase [Clostridia bacterium]|nr:SpoIIE family protein phosphatase [Clostridia bacterium]